MKKMMIALVCATAMPITPVSAKVVGPEFLNPSCPKMMAGWEKNNSVELPADSTVTFKNASKDHVQVLAKNKKGQVWQVVMLAPGASRAAKMSKLSNLAWGVQTGGKLECKKAVSVTNGGTLTYS